MTPLLTITDVRPLGNHRLHLTFSDGRSGPLDIEPAIASDPRPIVGALRDPALFNAVCLQHGTLVWPNGFDLAPEYLYFLAFHEDPALSERFQAWGFLTPQDAG